MIDINEFFSINAASSGSTLNNLLAQRSTENLSSYDLRHLTSIEQDVLAAELTQVSKNKRRMSLHLDQFQAFQNDNNINIAFVIDKKYNSDHGYIFAPLKNNQYAMIVDQDIFKEDVVAPSYEYILYEVYDYFYGEDGYELEDIGSLPTPSIS